MKINLKAKIGLMLYSLFFFCLQPILILRLFWRSRYLPLYRKRLLERFGIFQAPSKKGGIWLHAVSLGEVNAAAILIKRLQRVLPERLIILTTMTATGSQRVQELFGDEVFHVYLPYDISFWIRFFLRRLDPAMLIILETEIWPNLLDQTQKAKIPILLANARLSDRSFKSYQKIKWLIAPFLANINLIMAQSEIDKSRFLQLGASFSRISVSGNLKWDIELDQSLKIKVSQWKSFFENKLILVAGSTHEGEEEILLDSFIKLKEEYPSLQLILAPRHPERFFAVEQIILNKNLLLEKYSAHRAIPPSEQKQFFDVFLLDVIGQLMVFYGLADLAFVGGSLVPVGGHNLLEPAAWGKVILSGIYVNNFCEIVHTLNQSRALIQVKNGAEFTEKCKELLNDFTLRQSYVNSVISCINHHRGSVDKHLNWIQENLI